MDRRWELALNAVGLFLLITGVIGPLFMKPPYNSGIGYLLSSIPLIFISVFFFYIGRQALSDRQRNLMLISVMILYFLIALGVNQAFRSINSVTVLIALILGGLLAYMFNLQLHRSWTPAMVVAPQEREIMVDTPYDRTFEFCLKATRFLPWSSNLEEDREKGIISVEAYTSFCKSVVIISLESVSSEKTRVKVSSFTPGKTEVPDLVSEWNKGYIDSLCDFLEKPPRPEDTALMPWPLAEKE
jgi:protein-S-isoprenylcysteine O-methyltransferase Ste14